MHYDLYKNGFAYYCNDSLNYNLLNAVAMKYVITFFCRDFFIDNHVFEEEMDYKVNLAVSLYRMYKYDQALEYYEVVKKAKPELVSQLDFIETMGESTPKFDKFD